MHKIGFVTFTLLIALLRMAEFIYTPQQSPALQPVMITCHSFYQWYIRMAIAGTYTLYRTFYEFFLGFIPSLVMFPVLFIGSSIMSVGISNIWWVHYIRTWWRLLSWEGRSFFSIFYDANPTKLDRNSNKTIQARKLRRAFLDGCLVQLDSIDTTWRQRALAMNKIIISIQNFGAETFVECLLLRTAFFLFYSAILFGCSVLYFLIRIIRYKFGYLDYDDFSKRCPRKRVPPQFRSHILPTRRQRTYRKTRWRRKTKQSIARRTSFEINLMSVIPSVAFTTVLNIDDRVNNLERDLATWDTDSSSMVCDNSANVHICNNRSMFVGDLSSVSNHKVATIGGKGHQPSGIGTVRWSWRDDKGKLHEYDVENVLFFHNHQSTSSASLHLPSN